MTRPSTLEEKRLPPTFCLGCGDVAESTTAHCVHVTRCPERKVRPKNCPGCLFENWKRDTCRNCGMAL